VTLEVVEPGLLTTIQDAGRFGWTHLGVPVGGACDPWSLAVANLLAGADAGAAALEMTIAGPTLAVRAATVVGLAGADLGGIVRETGRRLLPGRSYALAAGTTIAFPGGHAGAGGARAYVALRGGIDVPEVLGSRSTLLSAAFGGIDGRPLRAGDVVGSAATDTAPAPEEWSWPWLDGDPFASTGEPIRVVPGPAPGVEDVVGRSWRTGDAQGNHIYQTVAWSPDSSWLLVGDGGKWALEAIAIYSIDAGATAAKGLGLFRAISTAAARVLRERVGASKVGSYTLDIAGDQKIEIANTGVASIPMLFQIPKQEMDIDLLVRFKASRTGDRVTTSPIDVSGVKR